MNGHAREYHDAALHESLQRAACAVERLRQEPPASRRKLRRTPGGLLLALVQEGFVVRDEPSDDDAPMLRLQVRDDSGHAQVRLSMVGPFAHIAPDSNASRPDRLCQNLERILRASGFIPVPCHMLSLPTALVREGKPATLGRALFSDPATSLQRQQPGDHHV